MRIRTTTAVVTAVLALSLVSCSSDDGGSDDKAEPSKSSTPKATKSQDYSDAEKAAGIPPEPNAAERAVLIRALRAVNPALVTDEDKAVDNARNQCATINGGGKADVTAQARFSTSEHTATEAEAKAINEALKASGFCKA